jgi:hypothetical protein
MGASTSKKDVVKLVDKSEVKVEAVGEGEVDKSEVDKSEVKVEAVDKSEVDKKDQRTLNPLTRAYIESNGWYQTFDVSHVDILGRMKMDDSHHQLADALQEEVVGEEGKLRKLSLQFFSFLELVLPRGTLVNLILPSEGQQEPRHENTYTYLGVCAVNEMMFLEKDKGKDKDKAIPFTLRWIPERWHFVWYAGIAPCNTSPIVGSLVQMHLATLTWDLFYSNPVIREIYREEFKIFDEIDIEKTWQKRFQESVFASPKDDEFYIPLWMEYPILVEFAGNDVKDVIHTQLLKVPKVQEEEKFDSRNLKRKRSHTNDDDDDDKDGPASKKRRGMEAIEVMDQGNCAKAFFWIHGTGQDPELQSAVRHFLLGNLFAKVITEETMIKVDHFKFTVTLVDRCGIDWVLVSVVSEIIASVASPTSSSSSSASSTSSPKSRPRTRTRSVSHRPATRSQSRRRRAGR